MKTLNRLVFISAFVGIAHAALIVPYWQQLEEYEEPTSKSPELKELEELLDESKELDQPAELEKSEELNGDPDPIPTDLANWPIWQTNLSQVLFGNLFLPTRKH